MGTFASRATHRVGNAVIAAAGEARRAFLEVASLELEAPVEDLETRRSGWSTWSASRGPDPSLAMMKEALDRG